MSAGEPASATAEIVDATPLASGERVLQAVDRTYRAHDLEMLRHLDEKVVFERGLDFFRALVRGLSESLGTRYAFAARFDGTDHSLMHVITFWDSLARQHKDNYPFPVEGTPCTLVLRGEIVAIARDVLDHYPAERQRGVQSYLAIPLLDRAGTVVGHLVAADTQPRDWAQLDERIIRLFAARTAAEVQRWQYEEDIERASAAAVAANRAKSEFLASMSHELRTPLNGILGFAQLLERDSTLDAQHLAGIRVIRECGEHLLTLINDGLDLARIEAGQLYLEQCEFRVSELLRTVADITRLRAAQTGIGFQESAGPLPEHLYGDARRLRQVLLNLLANAVKFTHQGGVHLRTELLHTSAGRTRLRFSVADTGIGIPADQLDKIFEPFHQVRTSGRAHEGTGLGLAITRRLVEAMGGVLAVESRPGEGTTFSFELEFESGAP